MSKCVIDRVAILAFCAIMVTGVAFGAQQLSMSFQEGFNIETGIYDSSYTGTLDLQVKLSPWPPPNDYPGDAGGQGDDSYITVGQWYNSGYTHDWGDAALFYFPDVATELSSLPSPIIDSAKLQIYYLFSSLPTLPEQFVIEVSAVTDPNGDGMWEEGTTIITVDDGGSDLEVYAQATDGTYRSGGPGGLYETAGIEWSVPHQLSDPGPPLVPGDCCDHGPEVDNYTVDSNLPRLTLYRAELDVTPIINDWLLYQSSGGSSGNPNQGFHIAVGLHHIYAGSKGPGLVTHEGAASGFFGSTVDNAPKLTVNYHYNGSCTADAGSDMGSVGDATPRVKPGEDVTFDGSASTPFLPAYPIEGYEWSWTYGTATHYLESTTDQAIAQLPMIVNEPDNISLTITDGLGLLDIDTNQTKVTAKIPGDIDSSGAVNLTDFVILRNNFGQSNP